MRADWRRLARRAVTSPSSRRLRRVAANVLALILILLAVHAWPVRELVRARAATQATRGAGVPVSIGQLRYNLLTLRVEADDIAVTPRDAGGIPATFIRSAVTQFSWRGLAAGRIEPRYVRVAN